MREYRKCHCHKESQPKNPGGQFWYEFLVYLELLCNGIWNQKTIFVGSYLLFLQRATYWNHNIFFVIYRGCPCNSRVPVFQKDLLQQSRHLFLLVVLQHPQCAAEVPPHDMIRIVRQRPQRRIVSNEWIKHIIDMIRLSSNCKLFIYRSIIRYIYTISI